MEHEGMEHSGVAIRATGLSKRYGDVVAVNGIDLAIAPGEVVAQGGSGEARRGAGLALARECG